MREHVGDFWDSIGNVNEINIQFKKRMIKNAAAIVLFEGTVTVTI